MNKPVKVTSNAIVLQNDTSVQQIPNTPKNRLLYTQSITDSFDKFLRSTDNLSTYTLDNYTLISPECSSVLLIYNSHSADSDSVPIIQSCFSKYNQLYSEVESYYLGMSEDLDVFSRPKEFHISVDDSYQSSSEEGSVRLKVIESLLADLSGIHVDRSNQQIGINNSYILNMSGIAATMDKTEVVVSIPQFNRNRDYFNTVVFDSINSDTTISDAELFILQYATYLYDVSVSDETVTTKKCSVTEYTV